jgi:hypothetical protein
MSEETFLLGGDRVYPDVSLRAWPPVNRMPGDHDGRRPDLHGYPPVSVHDTWADVDMTPLAFLDDLKENK